MISYYKPTLDHQTESILANLFTDSISNRNGINC